MSTILLAAAISLAQPPTVPAVEPHVAIKIAAEHDHVNPLPLDANEAAQIFGKLTPAQASAVSSAFDQLFAAFAATTESAWGGPKLYLSHSATLDYREAGLAEIKKELGLGKFSVFDPYSLGTKGNETDAVIMLKIDSAGGGAEKWTAVAFVLDGDVVQRIVVAPQPWIGLLNR